MLVFNWSVQTLLVSVGHMVRQWFNSINMLIYHLIRTWYTQTDSIFCSEALKDGGAKCPPWSSLLLDSSPLISTMRLNKTISFILYTLCLTNRLRGTQSSHSHFNSILTWIPDAWSFKLKTLAFLTELSNNW